jgi:hypothetical protein
MSRSLRQFAINVEQKVNKEEKLTRSVSSQLADAPRKTPAPANRDEVTQVAVNRRVASSNLARGATFSHCFYLKYIKQKNRGAFPGALLAIKVVREGLWGLR